jgi:hypothetical protein
MGTPGRLVTVPLLIALMAVAGRAEQAAQVEPNAIEALEKMGAYLRTLKIFQVDIATTTDEVLADGRRLQSRGVATILAQMPDHLRVSVDSDRHDRLWVYDGKELTLLARRANYYATVPARATISQLADVMNEKYDLQLPLEHLFRQGGRDAQDGAITSATFIGPSQIDGVTCGHYAFRQETRNWEIWIQSGDQPLLRKLVLTTLTDGARPRSVTTFSWNLAPAFKESAFTFVPPKNARKVALAGIK